MLVPGLRGKRSPFAPCWPVRLAKDDESIGSPEVAGRARDVQWLHQIPTLRMLSTLEGKLDDLATYGVIPAARTSTPRLSLLLLLLLLLPFSSSCSSSPCSPTIKDRRPLGHHNLATEIHSRTQARQITLLRASAWLDSSFTGAANSYRRKLTRLEFDLQMHVCYERQNRIRIQVHRGRG